MAADEAIWRVRAPLYTPRWLFRPDTVVNVIDVDPSALTEEVTKDWPRPFNLQRALTGPDVEASIYHRAAESLGWLSDMLDILQLRHEGSPVWWVGLDSGPQFAASLWDLIVGNVIDEKYRTVGVCPAALYKAGSPLWDRYHLTPSHDRVYLMSLDQFDKAEWPAESEDGPPYTPHVSVYR